MNNNANYKYNSVLMSNRKKLLLIILERELPLTLNTLPDDDMSVETNALYMNLNETQVSISDLLLKIRNKELSLFLKKYYLTNQFQLMLESGYKPDEAAQKIRNNINSLVKDKTISETSKIYILQGECNTDDFLKLKNPSSFLLQLKWELRDYNPTNQTKKTQPKEVIPETQSKKAKKIAKPSIINSKLNKSSAQGINKSKLNKNKNNEKNGGKNVTEIKAEKVENKLFAVETAKLTQNQILQQAGVTVLAQANTAPQIALTLLSNL